MELFRLRASPLGRHRTPISQNVQNPPSSSKKEYLLSRKLDEAASCVRELEAPHFHHDLVKRGVKIAMEEDGRDHAPKTSSALDATAALFEFLVNNSIVSE